MEVGDDDDGNEQDFENEVLPTVKSFKVYVCFGGNTSNLKKHLKKHNIQMNQNHRQDIREMFSSSKWVYNNDTMRGKLVQ
ncbi:unnamed protein product [Rhizophagus irregularis]|nr:unnamed protein product [Rhizophagus irregularis]